MSLASAGVGIVTTLTFGNPYIGMFCLLFSGLCDAFDGKVARIKKDRTETECKYGIQIDSLSDIVAFGILPACIGMSMLDNARLNLIACEGVVGKAFCILAYAVTVMYIVTALMRLAYFNVTEEERQKTEEGVRKHYLGLPVTSAAIIFPTFMVVKYVMSRVAETNITPIYFVVMSLCAIAFVTKYQLKKPGLRTLILFVLIGAVEIGIMVIAKLAL
jgi:CDP-diacylglycerol--serine O-phosphatidyltransferase